MSRVVRQAGQRTSDARDRTHHGSGAEATLGRLAGRAAQDDKKPNGFLSRHDKPATGRGRGRS